MTTRLLSIKELAHQLDATCEGSPDVAVNQVVHPRLAMQPTDLVMALSPEAFEALRRSPANVVVVPGNLPIPQDLWDNQQIIAAIKVKRPRVALAHLLSVFDKPVHLESGVHPTAIVDPTATIAPHVSIGAYVVIGPNVTIGSGTRLLPHVSLGADVTLGNDVLLHPGVRIGDRCKLGHRVIIHHNASIGADGFSFVTPEAGSIESAKSSGKVDAQNTDFIRINSIGAVTLGDDVEVGACACIDRGNLTDTVIGRGTKIDNLVMIGHNNTIGENCLIVSQAGVAGSCTLGNRVVIAGQAGMADHITIGDDAIVMAQSGVTKEVPAKAVVFGSPAEPRREAARKLFTLERAKNTTQELKRLQEQVARLESRLAELEQNKTTSIPSLRGSHDVADAAIS